MNRKYILFLTVLISMVVGAVAMYIYERIQYSSFESKSFALQAESRNDSDTENLLRWIETLIIKIQSNDRFSRSEEDGYFGYCGDALGQSLYCELGLGKYDGLNGFVLTRDVNASPLGYILQTRLGPVISGYNKLFFIIADDVVYLQNTTSSPDADELVKWLNTHNSAVVHYGAKKMVVIRFTNGSALWAEGITLMLCLRGWYVDEDNRSVYSIDLAHSMLGNTPLYKVLGFEGSCVSDFKISREQVNELQNVLIKSVEK